MRRAGPGFAVLYRWKLHPGSEADFVEGWARVSEDLLQKGSLGSRLHRGPDGVWYSYAQWPSAEARARAFETPSSDSTASDQMRAAVAERLPEIVLESVADYMVAPGETSPRFSTMIAVRDLDASEAFYQRFFAFHTAETGVARRLLRRPGASLYLVTESAPTPDKPGVTLAPVAVRDRPPVNLIFHVSDVRATHRELLALGVVFLAEPQQPPWGGWRCFTQDPDGYLIEIEESGAER